MKIPSILFIDDEEIIAKTVGDDLEEAGYAVTIASNGEDGIKLFETESFDMVITDLIMEGKDGMVVIDEIRKTSPELPVVILTGYASKNLAEKARHLTAVKYLLKPCKREELIQKVKECLNPKKP